MAKRKSNENKAIIIGLLGAIGAAIITGFFGLWEGGCNKQEPSVQVNNGDYVGGNKTENTTYVLNESESDELPKKSNASTPSFSDDRDKSMEQQEELEISIALPDRVNGYEKVFLNGERALTSPSSTRLNPRIIVKSDKSKTQFITIVTKTSDTCTLERRFDANEKDSFPIAFSPDCF